MLSTTALLIFSNTTMKSNLEIYELKILKGPERLLRINVLIKQTLDLKETIDILSAIIESLIFKHHKLTLEFPSVQLLDFLPGNKKGKYGTFLNGTLGMEILLLNKGASNFKIRYYSQEVEFERLISNTNNYISINQINIETYKFKCTLKDFREGTSASEWNSKLNFSRT
jgi:hypothetical protein